MRNRKALVLMAVVVLALLAIALLAASCGSGGTSGSATTPGSQTKDATINKYLNEMDQQMDSVNPSDFDESQLSNSALGI